MSIDHPALQQFRGKLASLQVTQLDAEGFDKWRNRENKCPPGSELKQAADALWAEFEAKGGYASCVSITRGNPAAGPAPGPGGRRPFDGGGRPQPGGARPGQPGGRPQTRQDTNNAAGADPSCLKEAFHNPYTFLPFPPADWFKDSRHERRKPTPLTMDEIETGRFTGVIDIELRTLSPLLTCDPEPTSGDAPHKTYRALTIGEDVIVPATGVRGSLRNLMSILAGGTLGYLDESAWLVQGRDLPLGPRGKNSPPETPAHCFLAEVVSPGTETRDGRLRLGQTRLIKLEALEKLAAGRRLPRPQSGRRPEYLWLDDRDESICDKPDSRHVWKLKLSGRPINLKGKREGLFKADGREIVVRKELWSAYLGRNRHGDHPELRPGDLVWLAPANANVTAIASEKDIASIQWARWGRKGEQLLDAIRKHHPHMLPDSMDPHGLVDEVTNLFGQVPMDGLDGPAGPFAARIRPENLVFRDAKRDGVERVTLAPLAPPHPGCAAFYRATTAPDSVTNRGPLRGLKVYRTSSERGEKAPWQFSTQGVYNEQGNPMDAHQKVNKTCELLKEGRTGTLRLACRSLSERELALVLLACSVDWRLGGGKPLGLGACRPLKVVVRKESGEELCRLERSGDQPATLPERYAATVNDLDERRDMWQAVMQPVDKLRYPRAVDMNRNRIQRGGHVWFARHANPKKGGGDGIPVGLEVLWADGDLKLKAGGATRIAAQPLPDFDPDQPQADCLYGYDLFAGETDEWIWRAGNRQTYHKKLEAFDPTRHATGREHSGDFKGHGQNRDHRQAGRQDARRGGQPGGQGNQRGQR